MCDTATTCVCVFAVSVLVVSPSAQCKWSQHTAERQDVFIECQYFSFISLVSVDGLPEWLQVHPRNQHHESTPWCGTAVTVVTLMYLSCIWKVTFYFAVVLVRSVLATLSLSSFPTMSPTESPTMSPSMSSSMSPTSKRKSSGAGFIKMCFYLKFT